MFEWQIMDMNRLSANGRYRQLSTTQGVDFSSNDYLGLCSSGLLVNAARMALERGVPVGSGGSRLLRGNHIEHELLEEEAARFFGSENALFFSTGFAANSALLSTLPQPGDMIIYDELVHASMHEGLRLTRVASMSVQHNDVDAVEYTIKNWRASGGVGQVWIAVEALYSMDGDVAPIADLWAVSNRHEAILIVDEAHSTGIFGENGRGVTEAYRFCENLITLRTFGKALGCEGAVITSARPVRDFLINRARGFVFSTAPSPLMAAIARASLRILQDEPDLRHKLWCNIAHAGNALEKLGLPCSGSPIIPVILGDDARTMTVANQLRQSGFDIRGIRPPTVPVGMSRLRLTVTLNVQIGEIDAMTMALDQALHKG